MTMKKIIIAAALLLASGCAAGNGTTTEKSNSGPKRIVPYAAAPARAVTQASSIATSRKSSITMKEAGQIPGVNSNWFGWFNPQQGPTGSPMQQNPTGNRTTTPGTGYPATQNPNGSWMNPGTGYPTSQNPNGNGNWMAPAPTGNPTAQNPNGNRTAPAPTGSPAAQAPDGNTANPNGSSSQFEQQVLDLVNQERSKAGLNALSMNGSLSKVAMAKAQDMYNNNYFDHNSPTYGSPFDMMRQFGISYNYAGENIAKGQTSPTQVMNDWMNSPGHKANIMSPNYNQIGIAYYNNEWVQEFTS